MISKLRTWYENFLSRFHDNPDTVLQCILSEGVPMETIPFGLVLSSDYEPQNLTLISIPRGTGELKLLGEFIT